MKAGIRTVFAVGILLMFSFFMGSCQLLNQEIMLKTPRHFAFDTLSKDSTITKDFVLRTNDVIEFRLFANDGVKMVDVLGNRADAALINRQDYQYDIDSRGNVKLPILGMEYIVGMTLREAEDFLEERYSQYYVDPFVAIKVVNRRVIIYPGDPGSANVIILGNSNTTVLEAIAMVGGISTNGKANNIKLIRQTDDPKRPVKIFKIDLSTINGLADGNTVLQSNDIIYVEPRQQFVKRTLAEVSPPITLITSLITFYYVVKRL